MLQIYKELTAKIGFGAFTFGTIGNLLLLHVQTIIFWYAHLSLASLCDNCDKVCKHKAIYDRILDKIVPLLWAHKGIICILEYYIGYVNLKGATNVHCIYVSQICLLGNYMIYAMKYYIHSITYGGGYMNMNILSSEFVHVLRLLKVSPVFLFCAT